MGKFLEDDFQVEQLDKGDIVDGKPLKASSGIFKTIENLTYITNANESITVPEGFVTDGYSKPQITEILVGGRYEDDIRPSTLHDYLCQYHGYYKDSTGLNYCPLSFNRVNDLFYEAMRSVGINWFKAKIMRFCVNFNPNRWG